MTAVARVFARLALLFVLSGCSESSPGAAPDPVASEFQRVLLDFDEAESLMIFAVDPDPRDREGNPIVPGDDGRTVLRASGAEWVVTGPLVVSGDAKTSLWSAVRSGLALDEVPKKCAFSPRHALVLDGRLGRTTILLCYSCGDVVIERTESGRDEPTARLDLFVKSSLEPAVTRLFESAGLLIAK